MEEVVLKRVAIAKGPSLLESLICKRWLFENPCTPLPAAFFTTVDGHIFDTKIHGFLRTNDKDNFHVVLIGETSDTTITPTGFFAMFFNGTMKSGILESTEKLATDLPVLLECCPSIFVKPRKERTPAVNFLRNGPRERKIALMQEFLEDLYAHNPWLAVTRRIINLMMQHSDDLTKDTFLKVPGLSIPSGPKDIDNPAPDRNIFHVLDTVLRDVNGFLADIKIPGHLGAGISGDITLRTMSSVGKLWFLQEGADIKTDIYSVELKLEDIL